MEKKMRTLFFLLTFIILTACSTGPKWVQEGKTKRDIRMDHWACVDSLLGKHKQFSGLTDKQIDELQAECMREKGYRDESKTKN